MLWGCQKYRSQALAADALHFFRLIFFRQQWCLSAWFAYICANFVAPDATLHTILIQVGRNRGPFCT